MSGFLSISDSESRVPAELPLLITAGRSIPLLCLEGVPDLHGAPQDSLFCKFLQIISMKYQCHH